MRTLSEGQARYVQFRLVGETMQSAYAKAFPGASKASLRCKPYVMEKVKHVAEALAAGMAGDKRKLEKLTSSAKQSVAVAAAGALAREALDAGVTRIEKRAELKAIILNRKLPARDRIAAIQTDNLMTGDNKPVRFEGEITLNGIFKALSSTTGLPSAEEVIELDPNGPMALLP